MTASWYQRYLQGGWWQRKCQVCGVRQRLEVHHLHYRSLGREELGDLKVLCDACHDKAHGRLAYPPGVTPPVTPFKKRKLCRTQRRLRSQRGNEDADRCRKDIEGRCLLLGVVLDVGLTFMGAENTCIQHWMYNDRGDGSRVLNFWPASGLVIYPDPRRCYVDSADESFALVVVERKRV
jgi:hypothetical protein